MFSPICLACSWKRSYDPVQDKEREDPGRHSEQNLVP